MTNFNNIGSATIQSTQAPASITVTGSPFSYQNTAAAEVDIIVRGGTVTVIEFSRNGSDWFTLGLIAGMFRLYRNEYLRVTYITAPTMTRVNRVD